MTAQTFADSRRPGRRSLDPVALYLDQLAPGSRRVMRASLELIADTLSGGRFGAADFPWSSATYAEAARLRSWLQKTYAPSTTARHLCAWRCVLREAWRLGDLSTDSYLRARDVRAPKKGAQNRGRLLLADEIAALLAVRNPSPWDLRGTAMVAMLAGCGVRRAELAGLALDDVDMDDGALVVRCGKGGRRRDLTVPAPLLPYVQRWAAFRGSWSGALFCPIGNSGRVLPRGLSATAIAWSLNRLSTQTGAGPISSRLFRKWWASNLLTCADLLTVQALAGHASATTTARYDLRRPSSAPAAAAPLFEQLVSRGLRVAEKDAA
jgi:site-specific recombinase XerC